jgi:hypothetical protein
VLQLPEMHRKGGVTLRSTDQLGLPSPRAQFSQRGHRASALKQLRVRWDPTPLAPVWWLPADSRGDVQSCTALPTLARGFGCAGRTNNYLLCWARAMWLHATEGVPTLFNAFWFSEVGPNPDQPWPYDPNPNPNPDRNRNRNHNPVGGPLLRLGGRDPRLGMRGCRSGPVQQHRDPSTAASDAGRAWRQSTGQEDRWRSTC